MLSRTKTVECMLLLSVVVFLCADIHSVVKLGLQSLVSVLIVLFTCSILSRLAKPVTSRLSRLFSGPVLPGSFFTVDLVALCCVVTLGKFSKKT